MRIWNSDYELENRGTSGIITSPYIGKRIDGLMPVNESNTAII